MAALIGSLIGALAAMVGAAITNIAMVRTEQRRQRFAKSQAVIEALRERSGAAFAQFLGILQAVEWITWLGVNDPKSVNEARIAKYDDEVSEAYSRLLGSVAMTASLSLPLYDELKVHLLQLYALEEEVAKALRQVGADNDAAAAVLRQCKERAATMSQSLFPKLNEIMTHAEEYTAKS